MFCESIDVYGVAVEAGHDGFDASVCKNLSIRSCKFFTGDDCIAGFENVNVSFRPGYENVTFMHACNFSRITFINVTIENNHSNSLIKTWSDGKIEIDNLKCEVKEENYVCKADDSFECNTI